MDSKIFKYIISLLLISIIIISVLFAFNVFPLNKEKPKNDNLVEEKPAIDNDNTSPTLIGEVSTGFEDFDGTVINVIFPNIASFVDSTDECVIVNAQFNDNEYQAIFNNFILENGEWQVSCTSKSPYILSTSTIQSVKYLPNGYYEFELHLHFGHLDETGGLVVRKEYVVTEALELEYDSSLSNAIFIEIHIKE